jgi:transposase
MKTSTIFQPEVMKKELITLAKEVHGAKIGLKIAALLLMIEGQRPGWISEVLGLSRMTLNRCVRGVNESGTESLKEKPKPGRPACVTPKIAEQLERHLEQSPEKYGLSRVRWDGPTMANHLQRQFGIKMKVRQAQNLMHQLGYRLKRASYSYIQAKTEDAKRFCRALKKTEKAG